MKSQTDITRPTQNQDIVFLNQSIFQNSDHISENLFNQSDETILLSESEKQSKTLESEKKLKILKEREDQSSIQSFKVNLGSIEKICKVEIDSKLIFSILERSEQKKMNFKEALVEGIKEFRKHFKTTNKRNKIKKFSRFLKNKKCQNRFNNQKRRNENFGIIFDDIKRSKIRRNEKINQKNKENIELFSEYDTQDTHCFFRKFEPKIKEFEFLESVMNTELSKLENQFDLSKIQM